MPFMKIEGLAEHGIAGVLYSTQEPGDSYTTYTSAENCANLGVSVSGQARFIWFILADGYSFTDPANNDTDSITYASSYGSQTKVVADGSLYGGKFRLLWDTSYKGTADHPISGGTFKARQVLSGPSDVFYDNNYTMTFDIRTEGSTPEPTPTRYPVTYALSNATVTPQPTEVAEGDALSLTFTASAGYHFEEQPTLSYVTTDGTTTTVRASDGALSATVTGLGAEPNVTVTATATKDAEPEPKAYPVKYDVDNATVSPRPETVTEGETVTFTATPLDGFHFDAQPTVIYMKSSGSFVTNTATDGVVKVTFDDLSTTPVITVTAKAVADAATTYPITYSVSNATVTPRPDTVTKGQTIAFKVTADDGYHFTATPYITWQVGGGTFTKVEADEYGTITATFDDVSQYPRIELYANAESGGTIEERYGIIRVYEVTAADMKAIAEYAKDIVQGTPDLSKYISTLRRFYATVPSSTTGDLVLGPYSIGRTVDYVTEDVIEFDCGSVTLTPRYGNSIDYKHAMMTAWLPFVGEVSLPVEICTGATVALAYRCNVLTGDCIALLSIDGRMIQTSTGNLTYPIPYEDNGDFNLFSNLTVDADFMRGLTPYVEVVESDALAAPRYVGDATTVTIGDCSGYCEFADFELSGIIATRDELNEISSLLESGVIA